MRITGFLLLLICTSVLALEVAADDARKSEVRAKTDVFEAIDGFVSSAEATLNGEYNKSALEEETGVDPTVEAYQSMINGSLEHPTADSKDEQKQNSSISLPNWEGLTSPERLGGNLQLMAVMAALSLAPAFVLMSTCYVRIAVVLALLRQALGSQQIPPNQVTTALSLFLTALIMLPVWTEVNQKAIKPYADPNVEMSLEEAWELGIRPVHTFMTEQILRAENEGDIRLFLDYLQRSDIQYYDEVPIQALLPAFLISELKVAFLIGFQIYLPFVIIDLVVSSVVMSMGMVMMPPTTISLPLKLLMFVLVDGWHLVVEMLLLSFKMTS